MNPVYSNKSEWIRSIRSIRTFNLNESGLFKSIRWIGSIRINCRPFNSFSGHCFEIFRIMEGQLTYQNLRNWFFVITSLAKVSDLNSFRTNPKFSESFQNFYRHQTVWFRSNPKLVFNPNQSEAHLKSSLTCNLNESENNPVNPN